MITKLLEVRDRATFIPVMAIKMVPEKTTSMKTPYKETQRYLLRRAGFGFEFPMIMLIKLEGGECQYDPYKWSSDTRTIPEAHKYIEKNFDTLVDGDVIDVEFILGETKKLKISESQEIF